MHTYLAPQVQEWSDTYNNVKIQFVHDPENPIVNVLTELKFSIQNLTTGQHIKDFKARITIVDGKDNIIKFGTIFVADGDFNLKYLFPNNDTRELIIRIDKDPFVHVLALFTVFQSFGGD